MSFASWEKQFENQINLRVEKIGEIQEQAAKDMLEEGIRPRTPYGMPETWRWPAKADYEPGKARAGWNIEITSAFIRIFNDVVYIVPLETGWSKQAPIGMMRVSALEWPEYVKKAALKLGGL